MDETYIVTAYVVLDDVLKVMNYRDDVRATVSAAEVLTVAVVAARYFQNHHRTRFVRLAAGSARCRG
ncbi:MAG: hypothetical protein HND48_04070 [Chloroflexi bacterium]|nr:hypothetical protein [Chloroflexota bacterium]